MNTVTCTTPDGKVRYYLADEQGVPVPEVLSYLKFLDNQGFVRIPSAGRHSSDDCFFGTDMKGFYQFL